MADLAKKKSDAISTVVALAPKAMKMAADLAEAVAFLTDNGFLTGGGNAIVDNDFTGENAHLTATEFNSAVTALGSMSLSTQNKTHLRKASRVAAV